MRPSTIISAILLTYKSLVLGRPHNVRRDMKGLDRDPSLSANVNQLIDPSDELSLDIPSLEYPPPKDPFVISMDQWYDLPSRNPLTPNTPSEADPPSFDSPESPRLPFQPPGIQPGIDPPVTTPIGEPLITDNVRQSFLSIKNRGCQYGLYAFSANKRQLVFKECGQSSYWKDLRDSISISEPGFTLSPLRDGRILSIRNLYNEKSQEDAITIEINEAAWLDALKPVFGQVIVTGKVWDPTSLAAVMYQYFRATFPSPGSEFQPGL